MDLFSLLSRYVCFSGIEISLNAPGICRRECSSVTTGAMKQVLNHLQMRARAH